MSSEDEAERAIKEFAAITSVDEALAHFFLQEFDFNLQSALNSYYREMDNNKKKLASSSSSSSDDGNVVTLSSDTDPEAMDTSGPEPGPSNSISQEKAKKKPVVNNEKLPEEVTVLSWNVDGLDEGNLITRFKGALVIIAKVNPEVILLQEVVDPHLHHIHKLFGKMYHIVKPEDDGMPYYTVTLVSKNILCTFREVKQFSNTSMGRTMTVFEGIWQKLKLVIVHSHLESMREHAAARKVQFNQCINKIEQKMGQNTLVIFSGDLNIRDSEIGPLHPAIKDAWIAAGSKMSTKYTWDCKLNSNKGLPPNVRCRFDRIYYNGPYKKVDFSLHGTQAIKPVLRYPSDHFAVVATFKNPDESPQR